MILKERTKSVNHLVLESLNARTVLSTSEKVQYDNQLKGYTGELKFDSEMNKAAVPGLIINDLLLSTRDTYYQIDALLITDSQIFLYEVKNYAGSYVYKDGDIISESGYLLQNPVNQAERKRYYLYNLLLYKGFKVDIISYVVYINPDCYIYALPKNPTILFAGQLDRHFESISSKQKDKNVKLANTLVAQHDASYRPTNLPDYSFTDLKTGIMCSECFSFGYTTTRQLRSCTHCGHKEKSSDAILRSIEEFRLLFPAIPVTKKGIYAFCGKAFSEASIKRILKKHYRLYSCSRSSYYN